MDEFLEQFLLESRELAQEATTNLLALEKTPGDADSLDNAFRAFHTIKGGAGIVDFDAMVQLVHGTETALAQAKSGERPVDTTLVNACLQCLDQVVRWLDLAERSGGLPDDAALQGASAPARPDPAAAAAGGDALAAPASTGVTPLSLATARELLVAQLALIGEISSDGASGRVASAGRVTANVLRGLERPDEAAEAERVTGACLQADDPEELTRLLAEQIASLDTTRDTDHATPDAEPVARTLRVDIGRIDALVRLTGELTVAGNAIGHLTKLDSADLPSSVELLRQRHLVLERLISQLQRSVLGMRVLPLRQVFQRFQRPAREISKALAKPVVLKTEGGDTEADKAIVEMLFEPLLHVLRNAMDHGIEDPAQRRLRGKPPVATVLIRAFREGDNVIVEVVDDGNGVDVDRVRASARERGLFSSEVLDAMTEHEVTNIIFQPGFSTSSTVTRLSGRGVGMDAVRHAVERFGGRVGLASRAGRGTTVRITLPFSAMMTRIMVVTAAGQRFGVPFDVVVETAQVAAAAIVPVGTSRVVVLRDRTLPVVDLAEVLNLDQNATPTGDAMLVITASGGQTNALRVDRIGERLDIMLNRLDGLLVNTQGIAGSAVLGDGSVLLVLDLSSVLQSDRR